MINKDDFKIELPHYIKQDIMIDLLVQNFAYTKTLGKYIFEDLLTRTERSEDELYQEFNDTMKQMKYEILAVIASKYGK
ncbi:MAG TPA: hypothetical protein VHO03_02440 [Ignavibacteriales bacterium]|nr:hypothetical protein [Ignavibacteriales bacterium]